MKFLVTSELNENRLLRLVVLFLVFILLLFISSDVALQQYQMGLMPQDVLVVLQGDEDSFTEPILFDILLEKIHISIFTSMITLILLVIIYMRVNYQYNNLLIHVLFLSAIFTPIMLILTYFYGITFSILWLILFLLWHILAIYLSLNIIWKLFR